MTGKPTERIVRLSNTTADLLNLTTSSEPNSANTNGNAVVLEPASVVVGAVVTMAVRRAHFQPKHQD